MAETTPLQPALLPEAPAATGPITCLGMTFADDEERRAYFTERLREQLQDPAFRAIEGFPIGTDADILALSDPPYYTACPNPFLPDIIEDWQQERATLRTTLNLPNDANDTDDNHATRNTQHASILPPRTLCRRCLRR